MKADSFLADMNIIGQSVPGYPLDPYTHSGYHPTPPPGLESQNTSGSGRYLALFSSELYTNTNAKVPASLMQACLAVMKLILGISRDK